MNELSILDSLFNDVMGTAPYGICRSFSAPKVDVKEDEKSYTLEMELPGKTENDVNIELDKNNLVISSKTEETKADKKEAKNTKYLLKERTVSSSFERKFTLPQDVDNENINASFKNGVLSINMMKKAISAPKKIMIEAC